MEAVVLPHEHRSTLDCFKGTSEICMRDKAEKCKGIGCRDDIRVLVMLKWSADSQIMYMIVICNSPSNISR
jgi:hypothetical protein